MSVAVSERATQNRLAASLVRWGSQRRLLFGTTVTQFAVDVWLARAD